jgi:hypothetical protein
MIINLDMDGTIVNFNKSAVAHINRYLEAYRNNKKLIGFVDQQAQNDPKLLSALEEFVDKAKRYEAKASDYDEPNGLGRDLLYLIIPRIHKFWDRLEFLPTGKELFSGLSVMSRKYGLKLKILSSPMRSDRFCEEEKRDWCARHLRMGDSEVIIDSKKEKYAKVDGQAGILIDDTDVKLSAFKEAGGYPVKFNGSNEEVLKKVEAIIKGNTLLEEIKNRAGI